MEVITIGIDIAKRIFQLHGVDKNEKSGTEEKINEGSGISFYG
jgi:hypothetical protein